MSKRSILIFVLLIALVVVCAVSLTACGAIKGIMDLANDIDNLKSDTMKTQQEIQEALGDKYYIKYDITSESSGEGNETDEEHVIVASNGTYSFWQTDDGKTLIKKDGNTYYVYNREQDSEKYTSLSVYESETSPLYYANAYILACGDSLTYSSKSTVTFLGRTCTKYVTNLGTSSALGSVKLDTEYIVDNTTGACLKYAVAASADTTDGKDSGAATFEAKVFKQGNDVDAEFAPEIENIAISEWDTTFMATMGLTAVPAVENTKLVGASIETTTQTKEYVLVLNMNGALADNKTALLAVFESFFNAGAKFDSSDDQKTSYQDTDLFDDNSDDEYAPGMDFTAYTSSGDLVSIAVVQMPDEDDASYCRISFTLTHTIAA